MRIDRYKVIQLMRAQGIANLGDLAGLIGVHSSTLSSWFSGRYDPTFENLGTICQVLDCTVDDLVVYDRPKDPALAPV